MTSIASAPNRLARTRGQLDRVPAVVRPWARNLVLRRAVVGLQAGEAQHGVRGDGPRQCHGRLARRRAAAAGFRCLPAA